MNIQDQIEDEFSEDNKVKVSFSSENEFRLLAPYHVALGTVIALKGKYDNSYEKRKHYAEIMDLMKDNVPVEEFKKVAKNGKVTSETSPKYNVHFTDRMIDEVDARYNELSVSRMHKTRMAKVKEYISNFKPTISLGDALYRVSFYLICNESNLAASTKHLTSFVRSMFEENRANNMLVDSAIMIGGQGKSTVQKGLLRAAQEVGMGAAMCHLPSIHDGVQDVFVKNEICIDDETHFSALDLDSLNKILDKSEVTIKGKYIKEWQAKSIANIFVGTNFLPQDVNVRRYAIRMVDENFKLGEHYGDWDVPGIPGDTFGDSYEQVVEWCKEGWMHLFYYCTKYVVPEIPYKEVGFDYGLQYKIKKACNEQGSNECDIVHMVRLIEAVEGEKFDYKTKSTLKNRLYQLANNLKLDIVERHKSMESIYDWTKALEIDETFENTLEKTYCFFHSDRFKLNDAGKEVL